jgi:uncharacterized protein YlxW (UPF0749 family)
MCKWISKPQFLIAILMMAFGVILISHIKSVQTDETARNLAARYKERQAELQHAEEQYTKLLTENEALLQKKADILAEAAKQSGNENLIAELERINILAGFTEVKGKGVVLTLNDKPDYDILEDPAESLVHDGDIRHAIDLFKDVGCAAISINGMRYVNSSFVDCIGPTIRCNKQRMTPPYVIVALGDPALLAAAIRDDQEFNMRQMPGVGLQVKIEEAAEVTLPAFAETGNFDQYIDLLEVGQP